MALKRYRVVRFATHYGVIDHGEPVGTTVIAQGEGEGTTVPLYVQDGDPDVPTTGVGVVFRAADLSPEAKAAAVERAEELNNAKPKKVK